MAPQRSVPAIPIMERRHPKRWSKSRTLPLLLTVVPQYSCARSLIYRRSCEGLLTLATQFDNGCAEA